MSRTAILPGVIPSDAFDPADRHGWQCLGAIGCADIAASSSGTAYDPWIIAGETSDPPDGTNDETSPPGGDYANITDPLATEPGHCWPFMSLSASARSVSQSAPSVLSNGGYYPANWNKEGINHYRRFVRLAPRMFGSSGRRLLILASGRLKATNARDCLDIVLQHDLVTTVNPATGANTTTFTAGKHTGFRWVLGNLGANEVAFDLAVHGQAMGPRKQVWWADLTVAAQANPESTAPAISARRGPVLLDLTSTGPDMDTTGSLLAFLFAARGSTAINYDTIGSAGGAAQDGSEVYAKVGGAVCLLSPGK